LGSLVFACDMGAVRQLIERGPISRFHYT
jgi:hypothetical protein